MNQDILPLSPLPDFIHLQAIDKARNIARDYQIHAARDLFGYWIVETRWGRIGSRGNSHIESFAHENHATRFIRATLKRRAQTKRRIGVEYSLVR
jgi:predicted DNA-binding WGR domain protein